MTTAHASGDAHSIASRLNGELAAAVTRYDGSPLRIPGLHEPGSAASGEGTGIFYHRPTSGPVTTGRRFDPRRVPRGLTQVVGHIGDEKCRELMPHWSASGATEGALRSLVVEGDRVVYAPGVCEGASRIIFTDGGMNRTDAARYELLDLARMAPLVAPSPGARV